MLLVYITVPDPMGWGLRGHMSPEEAVSALKNFMSGTPRPKTISARDSSARTFRPIFQSGTARPTLVGPLGPFFFYFFFFFFFFFGGGGGNLLLYSVYVHQNKIQETLFNVILIFRQGNREII